MGVGGISIWQLLIILLIVLLLFGAKRLRTLGTDLGEALKGFRKAVRDGDQEQHGPKNLEHGSSENRVEDDLRSEVNKKT